MQAKKVKNHHKLYGTTLLLVHSYLTQHIKTNLQQEVHLYLIYENK